MKKILLLLCCLFTLGTQAQQYPTFSKTLANGLKVIVCEKPGNDFAQVEVWYRTGSKDEKPGIRGMAHMFEHMMFRGTKNFPGSRLMDMLDSVGGNWNAYTTFDRTVYHEYLPAGAVDMALQLEADRMTNLVVTQEILNTEREVVGEELRNGLSNWYRKTMTDRYPLLYPAGHPYEVDVIGNLDEITAFTAQQCMDFYNNFYSPNNAFVVVAGNVKHDAVFASCEKYFGPVTKQLKLEKKQDIPDVFTSKLKGTDVELNFPVQIYSYAFPHPSPDSKDFFAVNMLTSVLFTDDNSILMNRLVKKDFSAYGIQAVSEDYSLYPNRMLIDVFMPPSPGNVKVKKAIREEISKVAAEGLPEDMIDAFIAHQEATQLLSNYSSADIAGQLGIAEYYFRDHRRAFSPADEYKKITNDDFKRVAATYFSEEKIEIINLKPAF
ncbi:MAG: peptidase M16 domain-containing protein [Bacteroidetes bacterium]|nr:MAG: peptidase M16 domain-containing protein [Bacteroidota bacterium]